MSYLREIYYRGYYIYEIRAATPPLYTYRIPSIGEYQIFTSIAGARTFIDDYLTAHPEIPEAPEEPEIPPYMPPTTPTITRDTLDPYKGHIVYRYNTPTGIVYISPDLAGFEYPSLEDLYNALDESNSIPVSVTEITGAPWWLSFMGGFGSWLGKLWDFVATRDNNVQIELLSPLSKIGDFFKDPLAPIVAKFSSLFQRASQESIDTSLQAIDEVTSHSSPWKTDIDEKITGYTNDLVAGALAALSPEALGHSPLTPEEASTTLTLAGLAGLGVHTTAFIGGIVAESMTLGQLDGLTRLSEEVLDKLGLGDLAKAMVLTPLDPLLLIPAKQYWYSQFTPLFPSTNLLINMVVKEKLPLDDFKHTMKYQGYSEKWSQLIWDAHFIAPDYASIRMAYHRGNVTEEQLLPMLQRVDLDPEFNDQIWLPNLWNIPPYTDLINMRVKEVISAPVFAQYLRWHGYDPSWGQRLWDAHFMPPTQGDIITAWRRQIPVTIPEFDEATGQYAPRTVERLDIDDVHKLMQLVDLDPRYESIFDIRLYRDPTLREARYMYESGAISGDVVRDVVRRSGLSPEYIDPMTEYLLEFTEREYKRRYLTALQGGVLAGAYTPDELTAAVVEAGFPKGVAVWMLKTAAVRLKVMGTPKGEGKPKALGLADLKKAYIKDYITETDLRVKMNLLGYEYADIDLIVQLLNEEKVVEEEGRRQVVLTTAQLINAFRYGSMDENELLTRLMLKGLAQDEAQLIIDTKKAQWGVGGE